MTSNAAAREAASGRARAGVPRLPAPSAQEARAHARRAPARGDACRCSSCRGRATTWPSSALIREICAELGARATLARVRRRRPLVRGAEVQRAAATTRCGRSSPRPSRMAALSLAAAPTIPSNCFASFGPVPSSSCLKNTNASPQAGSRIRVGPLVELAVGVVGLPQPQVAPVGGRDERRLHGAFLVLGVRDAQRGVRRAQRVEHLVVEPLAWRNSNAARAPAGSSARKRAAAATSFFMFGGSWNSSGPSRASSTPRLLEQSTRPAASPSAA